MALPPPPLDEAYLPAWPRVATASQGPRTWNGLFRLSPALLGARIPPRFFGIQPLSKRLPWSDNEPMTASVPYAFGGRIMRRCVTVRHMVCTVAV